MNIKFEYSPIEEIKAAFNLSFHKADYQNLRSVLYPSFSGLIKFALTSKLNKYKTEKLWKKYSKKIIEAFKIEKLKLNNQVVCYIHSISCEGWFDIDKNAIHVRIVHPGGENEVLITIIHELLHLATYEKNLNYEKRENLVEVFLNKPIFKKIMSQK